MLCHRAENNLIGSVSVFQKRGKFQSHDLIVGSPGGGEQPEPAKTVFFDRNLLYSAVLMFVNNCKIMCICQKWLLRLAPPGGEGMCYDTPDQLLELLTRWHDQTQ